MKIELSEKEITAIMAAEFTLRKSREIKSGGTYVEDIHDMENCRRISFYEAEQVLCELIDKIYESEADNVFP